MWSCLRMIARSLLRQRYALAGLASQDARDRCIGVAARDLAFVRDHVWFYRKVSMHGATSSMLFFCVYMASDGVIHCTRLPTSSAKQTPATAMSAPDWGLLVFSIMVFDVGGLEHASHM